MSNRLKLLRDKATRPRRTVAILLDGEVRSQIEAVEDEIDRLDAEAEAAESDRRLSSKSKVSKRRAELVAAVADLRAQAAESTFFAVLEGMQRTAFRALIAQHPARKEDGKTIPADRLLDANALTLPLPLVRACLIGHRERPDADADVLPLDEGAWEGTKYEPGMADFLLGYRVTHPTIEGQIAQAEPFITERQLDDLAAAALAVCIGDDAVPLPRRRSSTGTSADE